jgi:hypothetical protein
LQCGAGATAAGPHCERHYPAGNAVGLWLAELGSTGPTKQRGYQMVIYGGTVTFRWLYLA